MIEGASLPEPPETTPSSRTHYRSNYAGIPFARWLDLLYPPSCVLCQEPMRNGRYLCSACSDGLLRIEKPYCMKCGEDIEGHVPEDVLCAHCRRVNYSFEFALSVVRAEGRANEIMHAYKYGRQIHLHRELALLMEELWNDPRLTVQQTHPWVIVPVPLHGKRERWRWFNQSHEIAQTLARRCKLHCKKVLRRTRNTSQQALLGREQRLANLQGAFRLSTRERRVKSIRQKPVLLIDDVFTTGSTAEECARVLKQDGGAEKVVVLTVLRG